MKVSFCTSGFKEWPLEAVLQWAAPLGFDGVELWMGHIEKFQEDNGPLDHLLKQLDAYQLQVPVISGYTTFSGGFSGEKNLRQEYETMRRLLDAARQLRCPAVRTFAGHISSRKASPEQWGQLVQDIKNVMKMAEQYEVDVAVEIHYDTFVDNAESALQLLREVGHPRLKLVFDSANLNVEQIDPVAVLPSLFPYVKHVHLKNYKWDHANRYKSIPVPIMEGDVDNEKLLLEFKRLGYGGFVSLEYFGELKEENIKRSLMQYLKFCAAA